MRIIRIASVRCDTCGDTIPNPTVEDGIPNRCRKCRNPFSTLGMPDDDDVSISKHDGKLSTRNFEDGRAAGACRSMTRIAGEDWIISDAVVALTDEVVNEITARGGMAAKRHPGLIAVDSLLVDPTHSIPLKIRLFEGSYYPGKVIVNATFGDDYPIPVEDRMPFDATAVVDAIVSGFLYLVSQAQNRRPDERKATRQVDEPYADLVGAFINQGIQDYKDLVKAGVIVDGQIVKGWPWEGSFHGTLGYESREEVADLLAWLTEGGLDHDALMLANDKEHAKELIDKRLGELGLQRRKPGTTKVDDGGPRLPRPGSKRPEPRKSLLDILQERLRAMRPALPPASEPKSVPMEPETAPDGEPKAAQSLWELKRMAGTIGEAKCKGCGNVGNKNSRCRCGKWIPGKPITPYDGSWAHQEEQRRKQPAEPMRQPVPRSLPYATAQSKPLNERQLLVLDFLAEQESRGVRWTHVGELPTYPKNVRGTEVQSLLQRGLLEWGSNANYLGMTEAGRHSQELFGSFVPRGMVASSLWELKRMAQDRPNKLSNEAQKDVEDIVGLWAIGHREEAKAKFQEVAKARKLKDYEAVMLVDVINKQIKALGGERRVAQASSDGSLKYRGYTIEPSGDNFYVKDPSGHRAFGEVPSSVETAKKWIDQDILGKKGRTAQVIPGDGFADGGEAYTDDELDLMEGKPDPNAAQRADDEASRRRFIQVTFEDGNVIRTSINGTKDEVEAYYLGQQFELDETKPTVKAVKVEFIS